MWWVSARAFLDRYRFAFKLTLVVRFAEVSLSINANQGPRSRDSNQAIKLHDFLLARPLFSRR